MFFVAPVEKTLSWVEHSHLKSTYLPVGLESRIDEKILTLGPSGDYQAEITQRVGKVDWAGELLPSTQETVTERFRVGAGGDVLEAKFGGNDSGWGARVLELEEVAVPYKILTKGQTWSHDFTANGQIGTVAAHGEYAVEDEEERDNAPAFKISIKVKETQGASPASSEGTVWLRKSDGVCLGFELTLHNAAVPGMPGLGDGPVSRELFSG